MIDIIRGEWFWLQDCHHFYVTLRSFLKVKAHLRGQRSPEQNNVDNAQNKEAIILIKRIMKTASSEVCHR